MLPHVFKSLSKVVPIPRVRYQLVDKITTATHDMVNTRYINSGNNASSCGSHKRRKTRPVQQSTWCFPASDFSVRRFSHTRNSVEKPSRAPPIAATCRRWDTAWRETTPALLSPSFDEPMIALQTRSTEARGWDDFALDLSEFAENWGGTPMFNQSQVIREDLCQPDVLGTTRVLQEKSDASSTRTIAC